MHDKCIGRQNMQYKTQQNLLTLINDQTNNWLKGKCREFYANDYNFSLHKIHSKLMNGRVMKEKDVGGWRKVFNLNIVYGCRLFW